jgi:hypothetical protein
MILSSELRRQMDQGLRKLSSNCLASIDLNTRLSSVIKEGETAASAILSTPNLIKAAARENSPARSTHRRRAQL